jgi:hypothetical protein
MFKESRCWRRGLGDREVGPCKMRGVGVFFVASRKCKRDDVSSQLHIFPSRLSPSFAQETQRPRSAAAALSVTMISQTPVTAMHVFGQ